MTKANARGAVMNKRYAVLGLSVFFALALAVPALGGPSNPVASISASAKSIAQKALKKANTANTTANTALSAANKAQTTATGAQTTATGAQTTATGAQTAAATAKSAADAAKAAADAANANANTRISSSESKFGAASPASGTDTVTPKSSSASCPSGEPVLGGGYFVGGGNDQVTVSASEIQLYGGGWFVTGQAISGTTPSWSIQAEVMCGTR